MKPKRRELKNGPARVIIIPPVIPSSLQRRPTFEEALKSINRWLESFMILTLIFLALLITF